MVIFEVSKWDKSKYSNLLHELNITSISVTLFVINLSIPFISFKFLHLLNIPPISVTLFVLKLDKSKYSNSWQSWNIAEVVASLLVLILFIPFISFNLLHPWNILYIFVTFDKSKLDKSNEIILVQSWKNLSILVIILLKCISNKYILLYFSNL